MDEEPEKQLLGPFSGPRSEGRRPSYTSTYQSRKSLQSDPLFRKASGGVGQLMDEIGAQSDQGLRSFYPQYYSHEQSLSETLDALSAQAARVSELRASGVEMLAQFDALAEDSHSTFDRTLARFHQWQAPELEVREFQKRVEVLQNTLKESREKLQRVSLEVAKLENEKRRRGSMVIKVCAAALAVVFLAYLVHRVYPLA